MINLSHNQVETILQDIADGITVQGLDGSVVYANDTAAQLIGVSSPEELLVIPVAELMQRFELFDEHGQPMPLTRLPGRRALQGEESEETLVRFRVRATGEERWSLVSSRPIRDTDGQVLFAANVFHDVTEQMQALEAERKARAQAEAVERRMAFLAQASELLARSLDYETTLQQVAQLAVPEMADWCGVDLLNENGFTERVAVSHVDPAMVELAYELTRRYPSDPDAPQGVYNVLRTGEAELYPEITDEMLVASAKDEEHLDIMRRLMLRSMIIAPLKARGDALGALMFAWAQSDRRYGEDDVTLANELGRRAGLAVENARLYQQATQLNAELEQRVAQRTQQLEQEIREHEQAEAQLRQREQQLAEAQRIANVGSWEWDRASNKVTWSDEMYRIFGVEPESFEPTFEGVLAHYHPDDIGYVMETLRQQAMQAHEPYELHYRIIRPDGQVRAIHSRSEPIVDENGEFVRLVGTWQDVTELKAAEQALHQSQALFATVTENMPNGAVFVIDKEGRYLLARGRALEQMGYTTEQLEGRLVQEVLAPELSESRVPSHKAAFAGESTTEEVRIAGRVYQAQTVPLIAEDGEVYAALVLSQDITERKEAEETMRSLLRLSERLNATLELEALMEALTQEALRLTSAMSGFSGLHTSEGIVAQTYYYQGEAVPIEKLWLPGEGIPGWVLEHKVPYLTNDAANDPRVAPDLEARFGLKTALVVPVLDRRGQVLGFFEVNNKRDGSGFNNQDVEKLVGLAQIVSIAFQNALLFERLRELSRKVLSAQEEERRRLSRELHDSAGQLLTALSIHLKILADQVPEEQAPLREELEEARELVNEAHEEIRAVSHALRPPSLETVGLNQTLRTLAEDFGRRTGLEISYEGGEVGSLPDQVSIGFYRFLQETLSNIARHAHAQTVQISLSQEEDEVTLSVQDDGIGFNMTSQLAAPPTASGVGLLGLRERFDLLNGQVLVDSVPGQGTRVVGRCRVYSASAGDNGHEG